MSGCHPTHIGNYNCCCHDECRRAIKLLSENLEEIVNKIKIIENIIDMKNIETINTTLQDLRSVDRELYQYCFEVCQRLKNWS